MQEEIIKTALLGTEKYQPGFGSIPVLKVLTDKIAETKSDKEDELLKNAAIVFLYEESGQSAIQSNLTVEECPEETNELANDLIATLIRSSLLTKDDILFEYLIHYCIKEGKVLPSVLTPDVLDKALENKKKAEKLLLVCGETGKWLYRLNPKWRVFYIPETDDKDWETGSMQKRKSFLSELRKTNPSEAVAQLEKIFPQENANNRADFLSVMAINLSINDAEFLEGLSTDKSKKVKEEAIDLLKTIQGSRINTLYLDYLKEAIQIQEEKSLLGGKSKVLQFDKKKIPSDEIFNSGIEKVSSEKGMEDHIFWIAQMICFIQPAILAQGLGTNEEELIRLFLENKKIKLLLPYLCKTATSFQTKSWAKFILEQTKTAEITLLQILSAEERIPYYDRFVDQWIAVLVGNLLDDDYTIIPEDLFMKIFTKLKNTPYQINQPAYRRLALQTPVKLLEFLQTHAQKTDGNYQNIYFASQIAEMVRIIETRKNIHIN